MLHSLRFRLLFTFLLITTLAVAVVAIFARRETDTEFRRYVSRDQVAEQAAAFQVLSARGQVDDLEAVQALAETMGTAYNLDIVFVDEMGEVVISSAPGVVNVPVLSPSAALVLSGAVTIEEIPGQMMITPIMTHEMLAAAAVFPDAADPWLAPLPNISPAHSPVFSTAAGGVVAAGGGTTALSNEATFFGSVNRSFWVAAVAAIGVAGVLSIAMSQRILQPVQALTAAANRLEQGDLSQRVTVKSRDEIGTLAHAFNAMADGLQRQEQLRRHMVTDIAHELRTPLTNIRGYLEALQDGYMDASPAVIDSLHQESLLLHRLINDLQELSLAEAGQLKFDPQPVALAEVIEPLVGGMRPQLDEKSLTLTTNLPPDLPLILADSSRLGQVFRNLLQNAITHTPERGRITLSAQVEGGEVLVQVQDSGPGIPPEHLPHLFDRFYRADTSRDRATGGTGLGLAIVKALVEGMRGRVWAENGNGEGARFQVALPMVTPRSSYSIVNL